MICQVPAFARLPFGFIGFAFYIFSVLRVSVGIMRQGEL